MLLVGFERVLASVVGARMGYLCIRLLPFDVRLVSAYGTVCGRALPVLPSDIKWWPEI